MTRVVVTGGTGFLGRHIVDRLGGFDVVSLSRSGAGVGGCVGDVLDRASLDAVFSEATAYRAYNISGAEVLSYRQMVERVFAQLGRRAILIPIPLTLIKLLISIARIVPSYRYLSGGMAERMSKDMVFDHDDAAKDFAFSPRSFALSDGDVA